MNMRKTISKKLRKSDSKLAKKLGKKLKKKKVKPESGEMKSSFLKLSERISSFKFEKKI